MSKSYGNTIGIREEPAVVERSIKTMPTDPARIRRTDAGDPARCPLWQLHLVYSDKQRKNGLKKGANQQALAA
jgi:tryptophanyl-tRNA synthetase